MPINRNAMLRYLELDRCFRNPGRKYQIEDLIEACNKRLEGRYGSGHKVSRRTVYNDIEFMSSSDGWSAPVEKDKDGRKVFYKYEDQKFSINNAKVNDAELNQIQSALTVLQRFKGMPQFSWVSEIIAKLESSFDAKKEVDVISFQHNEFLEGLEYLDILFNAIVYKKCLMVRYHSFKHENASDVLISPYYLKQFNNRWFLFAHNHESEYLQNMSLDRIRNIDEVKGEYEQCEVDFEDYFYDIYGVSRPHDGELVEVELRFNAAQAPYIKTKPIHGSQKYKEDEDGSAQVRLKLIPTFEFRRLILSYGAACEIIAPEQLVNEIKEELRKHVSMYEL